MSDVVNKFKKLGNITHRAISALGVLSANGNADTLYTAADVTEKMISSLGFVSFTDKEHSEMTNIVSVSLNQASKKRNNDLFKSNKKIRPVYATRKHLKSSVGYRIGRPMKYVDLNEIREGNEILKNPTQSCKDVFEVISNTNDLNRLFEIQEAINARTKEIFEDYKLEILKMSNAMIKFKDIMKNID
jgi:hypothetical protein